MKDFSVIHLSPGVCLHSVEEKENGSENKPFSYQNRIVKFDIPMLYTYQGIMFQCICFD